MKKLNLAIIIIVAVALACAFLAFQPTGLSTASHQEKEPIKIGFIGPIGSFAADTGIPPMNGLKLANEMFPEVNGQKIELLFEDDKLNPAIALTAAKKLVETDGANIILTVGSASTLAILPYAKEKGFLLATSVSASPKLTDAGSNFFRISSSSKEMASKAADVAFEKGFKKVTILYQMDEYPIGWKESFKNELEKKGGKVLAEEALSSSDQDFKTQIEKISKFDSDAIVVAIISSAVGTNVLKQVHELGISKQLIGNETFSYNNIVKDNSGISEGMLVSTYDFDTSRPEVKKFRQQYEKFNYTKGSETYAALGFDIYTALRDALEHGKKSPEEIRNFLIQRGKVQGIAGEYSITPNGNAERKVILNRIHNSTLEKVQ